VQQVATPVPLVQQAPAVATPPPAAVAPPSTTVSLITDGAKPAEAVSEDKAGAKTDGTSKPESAEADLAAGATDATAQQQMAPREQQLLQQLTSLATGQAPAQQQQPQQPEGEQQGGARRRRNTRVFVFPVGHRRLLINNNQAEVFYAIKTNASEPWAEHDVVKRKLMAAAAGFGLASGTSVKGLYTLLSEHGVSNSPAFWVDGEQLLAGEMAMTAPRNRFINSTTNWKDFAHKLFNPRDLMPAPARNATNVTVAEPAFVMANRRWVWFVSVVACGARSCARTQQQLGRRHHLAGCQACQACF
jgi:hypothetical protein